MSLDSVHSQRGGGAATGGPMSQVMGRRWAVAAGHPLAAQAAARVLAAGGNAIDAGVAGGMVLGIVHFDMVSFAGVAPILVHLARTGETVQVSGVGPYPRRASAELFRTQHGGELPNGILRTVVPAAPAAWLEALSRWGTMRFADVIAPGLELAADGFALSAFSAFQLRRSVDRFSQYPSSAAVFTPYGRPPEAGDAIVQRDLGETLRRMIAAETAARRRGRAKAIRAARDEFYKGETARRIVEFHAREGGLLGAEDLSSFEVEVAPALRTTFGAREIAACGFWCQGPVLLQMMNLLEPYDVAAMGHNSPRLLHLLAEITKLAFSDREAYYGDPLHVKVPADGLLSKVYADARRALVHEDRAWPDLPPPGDPIGLHGVRNGGPIAPPPRAGGPRGDGSMDTSYIAVIDAEGNGFSATPSDPSVEAPIVPGVGCMISARGSQGWLEPGHPSEVAPGKRPRLTPAPAMALRDGRVELCFGTPGGDVQQQAMLQTFLNITAFGMMPQAAVDAPRVAARSFPDSFWPHTHLPGVVEVESRVPAETRAALAALGHTVSDWPDWDWRAGGMCVVHRRHDGTLLAGADSRRGALAIGW
jgi:gamma-glutamyltranspeptidase/glutathione hydrolase